jgi:hypothetical protein
MSKRVSQIILTDEEPRRNPGTDLWYDTAARRLYFWNMDTEAWQLAVSGGAAPSTPTTGSEDTGGGDTGSGQISTTDIIEGSKLFFTGERARLALSGLYVTPGDAIETYLSRANASSQYLTQLNASATYTPLTTFNSQLVSAFAALEALSAALEGFDGDLATAIANTYLSKESASTIYATKAQLAASAAMLDANAIAYAVAL